MKEDIKQMIDVNVNILVRELDALDRVNAIMQKSLMDDKNKQIADTNINKLRKNLLTFFLNFYTEKILSK